MKKSSADNGPEKGNLEEVFRHGLGQGEATPGHDLWSRIDQQLDQQQQVGKYKRRAGYLALLSALLMLLVGSVALHQFLPGFTGEEVISDAGTNVSTEETVAPDRAAVTDGIKGLEEQKTTASEPNSAAEITENNVLEDGNYSSENLKENTALTLGATSSTKASGVNNQTKTINIKAPLSTQQNRAAGTGIAGAAGQISNGNNLAAANKKTGSASKNFNQNQAGNNSVANEKSAPVAGAAIAHNTKPAAGKNNAVRNENDEVNKATGNSGKTNSAEVPANMPPAGSGKAEPSSNSAINMADAGQSIDGESDTRMQETPTSASKDDETFKKSEQEEKPESAKQELVVATPAADTALALPAPVVPNYTGRWTFSATYSGYQFEQGLVLSSRVPVTTQPVNNSDITRYQQATQEFNELTKPSSSYRVELRAGYWMHKLLRLEAGLSYANNKAVTQNTYVIQSFIQGSNGDMQMSGESSVLEPYVNKVVRDSVAVQKGPGYETTYQYQFLAVPVRLVYQSDTDGWHWFATGGLSGGMLLSSSIQSTKSNNGKELATSAAFRKWQLSGLASFGLGYQIGDFLSLQAGPDLSYSFNSLLGSERSGIRQKNPYTVGLVGGVTYTF